MHTYTHIHIYTHQVTHDLGKLWPPGTYLPHPQEFPFKLVSKPLSLSPFVSFVDEDSASRA